MKTAKCRIKQTTPYDTIVCRCLLHSSNSFLVPRISAKFHRGYPPNGGIEVGYRFKRRFSTNISLYLRNGARHGHSYSWNANRNSYVLYRMVLFSVTLNDPNYHKPTQYGANNSSCSPNDQLPGVRRSQVPTSGHRRDQHTVVCQIRWRQPVETLVDDHRQLN